MKHVRTRTDNAHVALEHIEELWQLVDVGLAHEVAEGKLARVVLGGLYQVGIFVNMHGTELVAHELLAVHPRSCLLEEQRAGTLNLDDEPDDRNEWNDEQQGKRRHNQVEGALDKAVAEAGQRILVVGIGYHVANRLHLIVTADGLILHGHVIEVYHVGIAIPAQLLDVLVACH